MEVVFAQAIKDVKPDHDISIVTCYHRQKNGHYAKEFSKKAN